MSYITEINKLTDDVKIAKSYVDNSRPAGGGDFPEAVCCGLENACEKLEWREDAIKVVILISDAPPHGLGTLFYL